MSKELAEVREKLAPIVSTMSVDGASSREIVDAFRVKQPGVIATASRHLEDIALVKEVGRLKRSNSGSDYDPNDDLFSRIGISPVLPIPGRDRGQSKPINRKTPDLNRVQIIAYIRSHERTREQIDNDATKLRVLFQRAESFMKDDKITLREALALADAAEGKESGKGG